MKPNKEILALGHKVNDLLKDSVRVLIVSDEPDYREALTKNLELLGLNIDTTFSAEEAEILFKLNNYSFVIADINLSDARGDDFILKNIPLMKDTTKIIVTAYNPREIKSLSLLEDFGVDVIEKIYPEDLRHLITQKISERKESLINSLAGKLENQIWEKEKSQHAFQQEMLKKLEDIYQKVKEPVNIRKLRVFLCHSSHDKPAVRNYFQKLQEEGFAPWLDEESLLPGQDWEREISQAVQNSDIVVVFLSQTSTTEKGYIHKEIKLALDVADRQPEGTIFIIPARLEECNVPQRLNRWHWVNLFEDKGYSKLTRTLNEVLAKYQGIKK